MRVGIYCADGGLSMRLEGRVDVQCCCWKELGRGVEGRCLYTSPSHGVDAVRGGRKVQNPSISRVECSNGNLIQVIILVENSDVRSGGSFRVGC